MERSTLKDDCGKYYLSGDGIYSNWGVQEKFYGDDVDRLAAYENTGVEPSDVISAVDMEKIACALHELNQYKELGDIDRLRELVEADKGKIYNSVRFDENVSCLTIYRHDRKSLEESSRVFAVKYAPQHIEVGYSETGKDGPYTVIIAEGKDGKLIMPQEVAETIFGGEQAKEATHE